MEQELLFPDEEDDDEKFKSKKLRSGNYVLCNGCGRMRVVTSYYIGKSFDNCQYCREGGIEANYLNH